MLKNNIIYNETEGLINENILSQRINKIRYNENDAVNQIKGRIRRAEKQAKEGRIRKANDALDDGIIANLWINNNFNKTKSKFPQRDVLKPSNNKPKAQFRLNQSQTYEIVKRINPKSKGGNLGIDNEVILWMMDNDQYGFIPAIYKVTKMIVENGTPKQIRDLMMYTKGLPLGKEKDGVPDADIRPVVITDSIMRIIDKLAVNNIPEEDRKKLMGPYQMIRTRAACEIATITVDVALDYIASKDGYGIVNVDASNAYNAIDTNKQREMVHEDLPDLSYYFDFLYAGQIIVDFDHQHRIYMKTGDIQGLSSSELLYSGAKWRIQQEVERKIMLKQPNFKIDTQTDYIDDGLTIMNYKYMKDYMELLIDEYSKWKIEVNKSKTSIVLRTNNDIIKKNIKSNFEEFKYNFDGNITYLGVPHGTDEYIFEKIHGKSIKIQKYYILK